MQDPVRGEFRPTGSYFPHPGRSPMQETLTGVVTAPGLVPVAAEAPNDMKHGRAIGRTVLPVLVDRADPTRMIVLWDELAPYDDRAAAREQAQRAAAQEGTGAGTANCPPATADHAPDWARGLVADLVDRGVVPGAAVGDVRVTNVEVTVDGAPWPGGTSPNDVAATAIVRAVTEIPLPPQALPTPTASMCLLDLEVRPPSGQPFTTQVRQGFRTAGRRAAIARVGASVPVRIDPSDPTRVAIDVAAIDG